MKETIKAAFCFFSWSIVAHAIHRVSVSLCLYAFDKWGTGGLYATVSMEIYAVMLIGYLAFKQIFDLGKNDVLKGNEND